MNYFDTYQNSRALLLEGIAGGGKSTLIANHARECVLAGLRTLLITFSQSGTQVLHDYMRKAGLPAEQHRSTLSIYTIDGLATEILRRWGDQRYVLKKDDIVRLFLPEVLAFVEEKLIGLDEIFPSQHVQDLNALMQDIDFLRASGAYREEDEELRSYICEGNLHFAIPIVMCAFIVYEDLRERWRPDACTDWQNILQNPAQARVPGMSGFRTEDEAVSDVLQHPRNLDSAAAISKLFHFKYTLIDEFHDTTPLQFTFLRHICDRSQRIMAVGDRHQNIYGWRGANPEVVFEQYHQHFAPQVVELTQTYRYSSLLAQLLASLIGKQAWQSQANYRTAIHYHQGSLSALLQNLPEQNRLLQTAIICRDSSDLDVIGFALLPLLQQEGLSMRHALGDSFASQIVTFLVALRQPGQSWDSNTLRDAVSTFLALPHCQLSKSGKEEMLAALVPSSQPGRAIRHNLVVATNLRTYIDYQLGQNSYNPAMTAALQGWLSITDKQPLAAALKQFQLTANLLHTASRAARHGVASRRMIRSWHALLAYLPSKDTTDTWPQHLARFKHTYHAQQGMLLLGVEEAKGREFEQVIVYGLNEGEFPLRGQDYRLERNRFYVATSRARQALFLVADKEPGRFFQLGAI